ncbi:hypothetical protein [Persicobacter diffluens]|uniref:Lipid A biosynthesis protein n=1 Tax=Persicobacter diffluens TaxID=981 RepID=A0AAN5ANG7_9BACT|nr:lipid A biosynthesis protein [Persicobacter diffluens]
MAAFFYYFFLLPVSYLPMFILYRFSDFLYLVIRFVYPYRKKVVLENLRNSFPEKSEKEIQRIAHQFYRHFCDLIIESIALFSMSKKQVLKRFKAKDTAAIERLYDQGKSVIITSGHYNNWEMAAVAMNPQIRHQVDGVYTPLSNKFLNRVFKASREKFGAHLRPKSDCKNMFETHQNQLVATGFGTDQCPVRHVKKTYWTKFLNQETPVMFGTEKYAKQYDYGVVFLRIEKIKRGYYQFEFDLVEDKPQDAPYGKITERHVRLLEKQILSAPQYWLWTHKRWKLKPEMMEHNNHKSA